MSGNDKGCLHGNTLTALPCRAVNTQSRFSIFTGVPPSVFIVTVKPTASHSLLSFLTSSISEKVSLPDGTIMIASFCVFCVLCDISVI